MLKKTHVMTSEVLYSSTMYLVHPQIAPLLVGGVGIWFGAELPDIDQPSTKMYKRSFGLGPLLNRLGHRTLTHCLLGLGLFFLLLTGLVAVIPTSVQIQMPMTMGVATYVNWFLAMSFIGTCLHVIEDSQSKQGVLWGWPLTKFKSNRSGTGQYKQRSIWWPWLYTVGGVGETFWFYGMLIIFGLELALWIQYFMHVGI